MNAKTVSQVFNILSHFELLSIYYRFMLKNYTSILKTTIFAKSALIYKKTDTPFSDKTPKQGSKRSRLYHKFVCAKQSREPVTLKNELIIKPVI